MEKILRVNIKQPPKKIDQFCKQHDSWFLELDKNMNSKEIGKIFDRHIKSQYCSQDVIGEIAGHKNTPIRILMVLGKIAADDILMSLALNPKVTDEIAENIIMTTNDYSVLEHLFSNPKISLNILRKQLNIIKDPDLKKIIRKKLKGL
jgi:hypothetical protein